MTKENDNKKLKEEITRDIKDFEDKLLEILSSRESKIDEEINILNNKINQTIEKVNITIENYSSQQNDHKKVIELESFKNKVDAMLISHELRIKNNGEDLIKIKSKYDKVICDNLLVPGFIGTACQFRNLGEYLSNNISEISKMKIEKDIIKKSTKDFKTKLESMLKQMLVLNDSTIEICTKYTDNKQKDTEQMLDAKIMLYIEKLREFRLLFSDLENRIDNQMNQIKSEIREVYNMKEELISIINEKDKEIEKFMNTIHKKVVLNIQDIGILKRKINEINEFNNLNYQNISSKQLNNYYLKKDIVKKENKSNMINITNSNNTNKEEDSQDKEVHFNNVKISNYTLNTLISNTPSKPSDYIALNFDNDPEKMISNLNALNNKFLNKIKKVTEKEEDKKKEEEKEKEKENNKEKEIMEKVDKIFMDKDKIDFEMMNEKLNDNINKMYDFFTNDKFSLQKKLKNENDLNLKKSNENGNMTKIDSNENVNFELNYMPKLESSFLDQKILSDKEIKIEKEKKNDAIKRHFQNNLINCKIISGNSPLDLYNYSTSVPKFNKSNKKENNKTRLEIGKRLEPKNKRDNIKSKSLTPLLYSKLKNYNLVKLELDENASINPNTNNGAYIIAHKQRENNNVTRLNITPTSFVKVYDVTKRSSRLLNMTFAKEVLNMDKKYILKTESDKKK